MNRLQSELKRLYLPPSQAGAETDAQPSALIDASDKVRAMVMELTRPADWEVLSRVWQGVQAELELPAPAIAVSGTDGLQLWFSLAEAVPTAQAHAFLEGLRQWFLADIRTNRVRLMPAADTSAQHPERHARLVPALQENTENWSAFLAPDLVPVFADTPWLDIPPNEEGQATLLRGIEVMKQGAFEAAFEKLVPGTHAATSTVDLLSNHGKPTVRPEPVEGLRGFDKLSPNGGLDDETGNTSAGAGEDAKRFLLQVMNDETVGLALRIEAAKALLQHAD